MTRTMYDSVTPEHIPSTAEIVAGYVDGNFKNMDRVRQLFPHAIYVEITVFATDDIGDVLDVEKGDATPQDAPGWVIKRRAKGETPSVYCNYSTWPSVRDAFKAANVVEPYYWIADYTSKAALIAGSVATQYEDAGPFDLSIVADYWPGIDPEPPMRKEDMSKSFEVSANGGGVTFARGTCNNVSFFCDNTRKYGNTDLGVDVRVVIWATGDSPDIHDLRISNHDSNQVTVHFKNPSMTHSITVERADQKTTTIFGEVS